MAQPAGAAAGPFGPAVRSVLLKPLDPPPPVPPSAREVIERLDYRYKFQNFTDVPAAQSVTVRSKSPDAGSPFSANVSLKEGDFLTSLARPKFLSAATPLSATERGTATHLVLQHLDFAGSCDATNIERQIQEMAERRALSLSEAATVDREAIEWFLGTDLGKLIRSNHTLLRREVPVYFSAEPPLPAGAIRSDDPLDRIMGARPPGPGYCHAREQHHCGLQNGRGPRRSSAASGGILPAADAGVP